MEGERGCNVGGNVLKPQPLLTSAGIKIENCCPYLEDLQKFVEIIKSLEINNIGNQSSFICFYQLVFRAKLYLTVDWLSQEKWEA